MILVLVVFGTSPELERYEVCRVDTRTLRSPNDVGRLAFCKYINSSNYREIEEFLAMRTQQRSQLTPGP